MQKSGFQSETSNVQFLQSHLFVRFKDFSRIFKDEEGL